MASIKIIKRLCVNITVFGEKEMSRHFYLNYFYSE